MINKHISTFLLLFITSILFSQENLVYDYNLILSSVYESIENEDYELALKEIDKVHFLDPNYLNSIGVKAEILGFMDKQDERNDLLKKIYDEGRFEEYPNLYIYFAQAYNSSEKFSESIEILNNGISKFPNYALLYFYRCIANYQDGRIQAAVDDAKKTIDLDPNIARAHYLLGTIALEKGELVPGFLSMLGYLALRPDDDFSGQVVLMLDKELSSTYKDLAGIVFSKTGDDFTDLNEILRNDLPLNKKYKIQSKLDYNYTRYLQAVLEYAKDHEIQDGFFERHYITFLKEIAQDGKIEDFTYYTMASFEDGRIGKFIKKNFNDILKFNKEYIDDEFDKTFFKRVVEVDGEEKNMSIIYSDGNPFLIGEIKDGKNINNFDYIDEYGRKKGVYPYVDGSLNGEAELYYLDGKISEKLAFKDDKKNGLTTGYNELGDKIYSVNYKEGELDGEYFYSYDMGGTECIEPYVDGKIEGEVKCFYRNGQQNSSVMYKAGKREGKTSFYFVNGVKSAEYTYVDGKLEGKAILYKNDGSVLNEIIYEDDDYKYPYKLYNKYEELVSEGVIEDGKKITIEYNPNGDVSKYYFEGDDIVKTEVYEENKLTYSYNFKAGKLTGIYSHLDGSKPKKLNKSNITYYDINGNKLSTRMYKKLKFNGESTFYYKNGNISKKQNFIDGIIEGTETSYETNGDLKSIANYKNDTLVGLFIDYEKGIKNYECYYKAGKLNGPLTFFNKNGSTSQVRFFSNGSPTREINYDNQGRIAHEAKYSEGEISEIVYYYKGEKIDSINYNYKNGPIKFKYFGSESISTELKNGVFEGQYKILHDNDFVEIEYSVANGERNGDYKYFAPNGVLAAQYFFENGSQEDLTTWYDHLGVLRSKATFRQDEYHGVATSYYNNGKVFRTNEYLNDIQHGKKTYFNRSGDTLLILNYRNDLVSSYQLRTAEGNLGQAQKCGNERTELNVTYEDGSKALNIVINQKYLDEKMELYSRDGKLVRVRNRKKGYLDGETVHYHTNGQKYIVKNYKAGDLEGECTYYDENGVIQLEISYLNDGFNGPFKIYENGKLTKTKFFENGLYIKTE